MQEKRAGHRGADSGEAPGAGDRLPPESSSARRPPPPSGSSSSAAISAAAAPGRISESSLSSRQKRPRLAHQGRVVLATCPCAARARSGGCRRRAPARRRLSRRRRRCRGRAPRARPRRVRPLDRGEAGEQVLAAVRVHDAVGERGRQAGHDNRPHATGENAARRPSAFTPPYDRALAAALARAGAEVELLTSRFLYGPVPAADGYRGRGALLPAHAARGLDAPARRAFKAAEHLADMLRFRREADADVVHYQWLTVPGLDARLLPPARPRVMTAHYILPPRPAAARSPPPAASSAAWTRSSPTPSTAPAPARRGRARPRPGPGHPPRRLRLPDPAARREAAAGGARGRRGAGDPLLRPAPPLQGARHPARSVSPARGRGALDRRQPAHGRRAAARARRRGPRPGPLRHPLRRGRRDPGDLPPRRPRRPPLPRRRALRRPLHRPRLRQAAGAQRRRRLPRGRRDRRRAPRPARRTPPRSPPP